MKEKVRSFLSMVLIFVVLLSLFPNIFTETKAKATTVETTAELVKTNVDVKGNWMGAYGGSGYYLPFYLVRETYGVTSGRYSSILTPESNGASLISLPSYITGNSSTGMGNGYYVSNDITFANTSDERALTNPVNTNLRYKTQSQAGAANFQFNLGDEEEHLFSVYSTTFASTAQTSLTYKILDMSSNVLAEYTVTPAELDNGIYVTFKIKGSFKLNVSKVSGTNALLSGMFFDELPANTLTDFDAVYQAPRTVNLTWNNTGSNDVMIQRKLSTDTTWTTLTTVESGINAYSDSNLRTGVTYEYRACSTTGALPSGYTDIASMDIPEYITTILNFGEQEYISSEPGEEITFNATLTDSEGNALSGKDITFTLSGDLVGKFVEANLGSVITDDYGIASLPYSTEVAGEYQVTASFAADDTELLAECTDTADYIVKTLPWTDVPYILNMSDAVAPGELFSIRGYGMNLGEPQIKIAAADGSANQNIPPQDAMTIPVVQKDEEDGYFVVGSLPEIAEGGSYYVWVGNEMGWSKPVCMNAARILFISENSAWEGQTIEMSGRNLLASQFEGSGTVIVRLSNGTGTYIQTITRNTEYSICFEVAAPIGEYTVEVSNDGINWDVLENGQALTVVEQGEDPLGLGVAWADQFQWNQSVNVLDYGATGNDTESDTQAVADAIAAATALGGGVVYFPAGDYYISSIALPAHVVLLGESSDSTQLYYIGSGENFVISTGEGKTVGYQGVARITLKLSDANIRPSSFFWLGHDWGGDTLEHISMRTNSRYFLYEVDISYPATDAGVTGLGNGVTTIIGDHFLMEKCNFVGYRTSINTGYIRSYASIRDNYIEYATGYTQCTAQYTFMEDNQVYIHDETEAQSHGYDTRGNSHLENNYIHGAGGGQANEGESYFVEMPGMAYDYGKVISASGRTITLQGQGTFSSTYNNRYGYISIMIIDGKGIGQYRRVQSWSENTFIITSDWDIIPDATSTFTLVGTNDNVTFYRNIAENSKEGFLFYGNVIDGVAADNISNNTKGVFIYTSQVKSTKRLTPGYFFTVKNNTMTGVAKLYNNCGIYVTAQRQGVNGQYVAVAAYGIDIKNNRINGNLNALPVAANNPPSGIALYSAMVSSDGNLTNEAGDITNVIIQNNIITNLENGIYLTGGDYGIVLSENDAPGTGAYVNSSESQGRYPVNVIEISQSN